MSSLKLVGTSFYQDVLDKIYKYERKSGNSNKIKCELQLEPDNRHDENAIRAVYKGSSECVEIQGKTIAYVTKEETKLYKRYTPLTFYIQLYYHPKYNCYCVNVL